MRPIVSYQSIAYQKRIERKGKVYIDYRHKDERGRLVYLEGGLFLYLPLQFTRFIYNDYMKKVLFYETGYNEYGEKDIINEIEISECKLPDIEEGEHIIDELIYDVKDIKTDLRLSEEKK